MEIHFDNWAISTAHSSQIAQFDNGCHTIRITGNIPEGYSWDLLMQSLLTDHMNIVSLSAFEGGLAATLSANDLSDSGCYNLQLRGTSSADTSVRRHTNVIDFFVNHSLSGDINWPVLPTKFSQMEARIQSVASHPPIPDENGYWQTWNVDTSAYQSTTLPVGVRGLQGLPGEKGDHGADGRDGVDGRDGIDGKSAYTAAQEAGYSGTEEQFNAALVTVDGKYTKPAGGIPDSDIASASKWNAKQDALTAGDNIEITSEVIRTKSFPCNPNLLDNWYWGDPVNQRGWAQGNPNYQYSLDRWISNDLTVSVNDGYVTLTQSGQSNLFMVQRKEANIYKHGIAGRQVTISALLKNGQIKTATVTAPAYQENTVAQTDVDGLVLGAFSAQSEHGFRIFPSVGYSFDIVALKAEIGTQQTLARQENGVWVLNEIPDYGEQLRRCQRYYYKPYHVLLWRTPGTNSLTVDANFKVDMRAVPTVIYNNPLTLLVPGKTANGQISLSNLFVSVDGVGSCDLTSVDPTDAQVLQIERWQMAFSADL